MSVGEASQIRKGRTSSAKSARLRFGTVDIDDWVVQIVGVE